MPNDETDMTKSSVSRTPAADTGDVSRAENSSRVPSCSDARGEATPGEAIDE